MENDIEIFVLLSLSVLFVALNDEEEIFWV